MYLLVQPVVDLLLCDHTAKEHRVHPYRHSRSRDSEQLRYHECGTDAEYAPELLSNPRLSHHRSRRSLEDYPTSSACHLV